MNTEPLRNHDTLVSQLGELVNKPFSPAHLHLIDQAFDALSLEIADPLSELFSEDDDEICGRVNDSYYFDVTQRVGRGWQASIQVNSEIEDITAYHPSKYTAFLLGITYLLSLALEPDDEQPVEELL